MPQIRAVITEMLQGDQAKLTPLTETIVRANLLTDRIRSGELARFDTESPRVWQLATDVLHSPALQEQLRATQACRDLAAGDTERGSDISQVVLRTLQDPGSPWREPQRIVVDNCMMLLTGTLASRWPKPKNRPLTCGAINSPKIQTSGSLISGAGPTETLWR